MMAPVLPLCTGNTSVLRSTASVVPMPVPWVGPPVCSQLTFLLVPGKQERHYTLPAGNVWQLAAGVLSHPEAAGLPRPFCKAA